MFYSNIAQMPCYDAPKLRRTVHCQRVDNKHTHQEEINIGKWLILINILSNYFGKHQFVEIWTHKMKVHKAMPGAHVFIFLNKLEESTVKEIFRGKVLKTDTRITCFFQTFKPYWNVIYLIFQYKQQYLNRILVHEHSLLRERERDWEI